MAPRKIRLKVYGPNNVWGVDKWGLYAGRFWLVWYDAWAERPCLEVGWRRPGMRDWFWSPRWCRDA